MKTRAHGSPMDGITLPLAVPANTREGHPVAIGNAGLLGVAVTARVTADDLNNPARVTPQGLVAGQASVFLPGIAVTLRVDLPAALAQGAKVYQQPDGTYSDVNTGVFVGWKVNGLLAVRANA
ncbi:MULTISPECIES: hypothetical protein [Deinococcus]|uniref:DUF2190 family protein n=1 Tax=Deinococcus rhizophilus TaxID=3049544 RepID=A0ABT7JBZ5_9DEIO|nr:MULTISPECIES: hypothetical protein [Deinococcus]MDL2342570.1 hypothetical protein [Deinococcus rhizophilus]